MDSNPPDQGQAIPTLPKELWQMILSHLTFVLQGITRSVCREWRQLTPLRKDVMSEASFILKQERYRDLSSWTVKNGCRKAFLIKLDRNKYLRPLVVDMGSSMMYPGTVGRDFPSSFATVVGRRRWGSESIITGNERDMYVGDAAQSKRSILALDYPIKNGVVHDWYAMEKIWHQAFYYATRVEPESQPVLVTEPPRNPKSNREKLFEMMFESFAVPACYVESPGPLTLYGVGRTTGVAVCCGDVMHVTPIDDGRISKHTIKRIDNMGGAALTNYLIDLMMERGSDFSSTSADNEMARDIKERMCYVALDYNQDMKKASESISIEKNYELPDGQIITLNDERFRCPEAMFDPSVLGIETPARGLPELIHSSIMQGAIDRRKDYYGNVILSGQTTLFDGFPERLDQELNRLIQDASMKVKVKVVAVPERRMTVWIGGTILACLSSFESQWVSKEDYEEWGPGIAHKCGV